MEEIITNKNIGFLDNAATEIIENSVQNLLRSKKNIIIGICGGRSVTGIFGQLGRSQRIPWEKIHIFMIDERLVQTTDNKSNYLLARTCFINKLLKENIIQQSNLHPFIAGKINADSDIKKYEKELRQYQDYYDISLLSSGEDGHIGSLYPDHHSILDDSEFYIKINDSPKPPKNRMSASKKLLGRSVVSILLFYGEPKRDAYLAFNNSKINYRSCPAKIIKSIKESFVLTDLEI
jgi:6-phosphogluconolactonase